MWAMSNDGYSLDKKRYRRSTWFFGRIILNIIWLDLMLTKLPFARRRIEENRLSRYQSYARKFRTLAIDMGGVMIKLGQFLSTRVDILPPEIIGELMGLQDEVPAVPFEPIRETISAELGNPETIFAELNPEPIAAASLGQTYRAQLVQDGEQQNVVVKVQRPNIDALVHTDLEALFTVSKWIMRYRPISSRADVPALAEEFAETLWEELDYKAELRNAISFQRLFAERDDVVIPHFYEDYCSDRVLVMENVEAIKITDLEQMAAEGIDSAEVADLVLDAYFTQIIDGSFFHADPHPGNLFVRPLNGRVVEEGEDGEASASRPFALIFIDFGMVGRIERLNTALRRMLVAVTQQDSRALTEAYADLGFFLPGADLDRITEAQGRVLDQIYGRDLLSLAKPDPQEIQDLSDEFKDLLIDFPFQIPRDFVYFGRCMTMISGLTSMLNPAINPWGYIELYGQKMIAEQQAQQFTSDAILEFVRDYAMVPAQVKRVLSSAESGRLTVRARPDRLTEQKLERLERRTNRLGSQIFSATLALSGTLLYVNEEPRLGLAAWAVAASSWLLAWVRHR